MQRLAPRNAAQQPARTATRSLIVCVVDPHTEDYREWNDLADAHGIQLRLVASAEAALRLARKTTIDLWVVNTKLPGLSGTELCSMLKSRMPHVPVFLVAEEPSLELECDAWRSRASMFGCKPGHRHWLAHWLQKQTCPTELSSSFGLTA